MIDRFLHAICHRFLFSFCYTLLRYWLLIFISFLCIFDFALSWSFSFSFHAISSFAALFSPPIFSSPRSPISPSIFFAPHFIISYFHWDFISTLAIFSPFSIASFFSLSSLFHISSPLLHYFHFLLSSGAFRSSHSADFDHSSLRFISFSYRMPQISHFASRHDFHSVAISTASTPISSTFQLISTYADTPTPISSSRGLSAPFSPSRFHLHVAAPFF